MRAATAAMEAAAQNVGSADPISSHGAAWAMIAPPGIDSQTMRLGLRRCLPPALSKVRLCLCYGHFFFCLHNCSLFVNVLYTKVPL